MTDKDTIKKEVRKKMEEQVILKRYTCERCGHSWLPRSEDKPRVCPGCTTPYWDVARINKSKKVLPVKKEE